MAFNIPEKELLKQICDLVIRSGVCPEIMPLEWMRRLLFLHRHRWLYCSVKGNQLLAVAAAYRIPEWDDKYLQMLPDQEEGSVLYVPFIAAEGRSSVAPLRLLRYCLRENPGITEVIYYRKNLHAAQKRYFIRPQVRAPQARVAAKDLVFA
jgi:hypothetical protein